MSLQFVAMRDEYLQQAADIYNYYVSHTTVTFHTELLSAEQMKPIVYQDDPIYATFAILDEGELCGYAYTAPYKKRQAYRISAEVTLYLSPGHTGKGIGSQALRLLEKHAAGQGIRTLLAVICSENEASAALFAEHGYEQCAHFKEVGMKFGRILDVIVFQKILDPLR